MQHPPDFRKRDAWNGRWIVFLAPFAFIMVMNFGIEKLSVSAMTMCFLAFAGTIGISLGGSFCLQSR